MTAPASAACPIDLPGAEGQNSIAREPMWHAWATGTDRPVVPEWTYTPVPPPELHTPPAPLSRRSRAASLPFGTVDLLTAAGYPAGRLSLPAGADRLGHALVTAFGLQRREPGNPYNDHRPYPSARCLFPVEAFLRRAGAWYQVLPQRHAVAPVAPVASATAETEALVLTGRYSAIPYGYKWFRGSLVNLEIGFVLRSLALGLELAGTPAWFRLPDGRLDRLAELGLDPTWDWSLPLTVELAATDAAIPATAMARPAAEAVPADDAVLADVIRVNRLQAFAGPAVPIRSGIPDTAGPSTVATDWALLLWERHSGRMPRAMHGMSGVRSRTPGDALDMAAAWVSEPPPGAFLADLHAAVTVSVVTQDVDGYTDGVHRVGCEGIELHRSDAFAVTELERYYGFPLAPGNGCDIRHAAAVWFLSIPVRDIVATHGAPAWTAVQYVCGWMAQGLCLAAASSGMYARPVRAFMEIPSQRLLGLPPTETITLAVVVGVGRPADGALLDLRV